MQILNTLIAAAMTSVVMATGTSTSSKSASSSSTMKTSTTSAAPSPSFTGISCTPDTKCHDPFYIKCKNINGFSGYVQSQDDGQVFCGANNGLNPGCGSDPKPYFTFLSNGGLLDSRGRVAEVNSNNGQFQFNLAAYSSAQSGFALATCGSKPGLTYKGSSTFYACGQNSARLYPGTQDPAPGSNPAANGCQPFTVEVEYIL